MELACALHLAGVDYPKGVKLAAEAGFDAYEVSPWLPRRLTDTDINILKVLLKKNGLKFSGFTAIYPPEMIVASLSPHARGKIILYTNRLIDLVDSFEGHSIVWGSPRSRRIPRGVSTEVSYRRLIETSSFLPVNELWQFMCRTVTGRYRGKAISTSLLYSML